MIKQIQANRRRKLIERLAAAKRGGINSGISISGHIKVWITRVNGNKELVFEDHNAIQAEYAEIIVDALAATVDYDMDNLFNGNANPPPDGQDGIAIKDNVGGLWYEMNMQATVKAAGNVTFTGIFTGTGITIANANQILLGHGWIQASFDFTSVGAAYGHFSKPSSWASQAVLAAETLTVEWIIKHQAT